MGHCTHSGSRDDEGSKGQHLPEDSGHLCDPHIHQLAHPGGAEVFWDNSDAAMGHMANHEPACGQRTCRWAHGRGGTGATGRGACELTLGVRGLWGGRDASRGRGPDPAGPRWLWGPGALSAPRRPALPVGPGLHGPAAHPGLSDAERPAGRRGGQRPARPLMQTPPDTLTCWGQGAGLLHPGHTVTTVCCLPLARAPHSRPRRGEDWGCCE